MRYSVALDSQLRILDFIRRPGVRESLEADYGNYGIRKTGTGTVDLLWQAAYSVLTNAAPFYWSPQICDVVASAAATVPDVTINQDLFPVQHGFCYLDRALPLPNPGLPYDFDFQAFGWVTLPGDPPRIIVVTFLNDPIRSETAPATCVRYDMGMLLSHQLREVEQSTDVLVASRAREQYRYVTAALLFVNQRLLGFTQERADRATRHRAERQWPDEPIIRVVHLRRRESVARTHDDRAAPDWHYQWLVRGHWRQQWYGRDGIQRPKWIAPYVKGPDDKPLKPPRATVFAVVR